MSGWKTTYHGRAHGHPQRLRAREARVDEDLGRVVRDNTAHECGPTDHPARLSLDAAELLHEHTAHQLALSPGVKALTRRTTTGQRDGFVGPG